jgi:hypothetical protein
MGQPLYGYQAAATGFPDRADFWITPDNLLHRMNFAVALGAGGIEGVILDPQALAVHHEPGAAEQALEIYARAMLPEQDVAQTVGLLQPVVRNPRFLEPGGTGQTGNAGAATTAAPMAEAGNGAMPGSAAENVPPAATIPAEQPDPMLRIIGMIAGSPQFQVH